MRLAPIVQSLTEPLLSPLVSAITGASSSGFSPTSLFVSGQQGYVYDLNDLPTVFLDSAGTTAASVNGLVGLVLDKSKGLALGAELLSSGAIGVTGTATAATYNTSTGAGTVTRVDGSNQSFVTFTGLTSTAFYQVTIQNTGSNILSFRQGTFASTILGDIGVGQTKTFISLATTSQLTVTMSPVAGSGSFVISTFKALAGNHAYQATTGNKPVLRGSPIGANLVTNGDFATDTVWNKGAGWSIGSGVATKAAGTTNSLLQAISLTAGKVYRLTYTITATAGGVQPLFSGGTSAFGVLRSASGTYVEWLTANTGNVDFGFTVNALFAGTVDNVEVVDVSAGQVQAPYALQFDGVDDFLQTASVNFETVTSDGLARRNLYTSSNGFTAGTGTTITSGIADTPITGLTASRYAKTDATTPRYQNSITTMTVAANTTYTASRYFKYDGFNTTVSLEYNNSDNWGGVAWVAVFNVSSSGVTVSSQVSCTASVVDVGNGWYRAIATFTTGASIVTPTNPFTLTRITGASGNSVLMASTQLEASSTASTFQNIGTDKMTVCHGVRKLSDAALGVVVELGTSVFVNAGAFWIAAPDSAANNLQFRAGGTTTANLVRTGLVAPTTLVVLGRTDISGDSLILRVNQSETTSLADQGTGNLRNDILYFGRRAGTSLPYNGLMFSAICVGKAVSATELASIERWTNQRTGAY